MNRFEYIMSFYVIFNILEIYDKLNLEIDEISRNCMNIIYKICFIY